MILKNSEIVGFAQRFDKAFENETQYFPAKVNFYIHKNIKTLLGLLETIENTRKDILKRYGIHNKDTDEITFTEESKDLANQELLILFNLEQEVPISMIKLSDLEGLHFTPDQMQVLLFMIEED